MSEYAPQDRDEKTYKSYGHRRSLRLEGFDYSRTLVYHITWGTYHRRPHLADEDLASEVVGILLDEARESCFELLAFCVMPDHVHLLVQTSEGTDLIRFVQSVKGKSTRAHWRLVGGGKLWQRSFYDHVLRSEEGIPDVARYILANPMRAGLVDRIADYPFCGSTVFQLEDL